MLFREGRIRNHNAEWYEAPDQENECANHSKWFLDSIIIHHCFRKQIKSSLVEYENVDRKTESCHYSAKKVPVAVVEEAVEDAHNEGAALAGQGHIGVVVAEDVILKVIIFKDRQITNGVILDRWMGVLCK